MRVNFIRSCYLLFFVLILSNLQAQPLQTSGSLNNRTGTGVLTGTVVDAQTQQPLVGASVYVHEAKTGASTDNNGNYRISNLSNGKFLVEVSYQGYGSAVVTVTVDGTTQKDFALSSVVIENQGVTVTGVSGATQIKRTPTPVTIIRKENLLQEASTNLIDALSRTPGVSQVSTGPGYFKTLHPGSGLQPCCRRQ